MNRDFVRMNLLGFRILHKLLELTSYNNPTEIDFFIWIFLLHQAFYIDRYETSFVIYTFET